MNQIVENALYHLFIDGQGDKVVFVFVGRDPRADDPNGPLSEPVTLDLLPARHRFGGTSGVGVGRPVLGRRPDGLTRFRQFVSVGEMEDAGCVQVKHYRVCDCWDDYYTPWSFATGDGSTAAGPTG
ncbi:MAG TPA: hypothetical protein VMZ71_14360 [Gemmataceae bacterium]|nr:hypothetical protein [Gemmataceae bacterium]